MDSTILDKDLLEVEEVAEYLKVGKATVYRWCRDGRMPCSKLGKSWRIRREALEDFIRQGERPVTLSRQLQSFLEVPDNVIGVCQTVDLLHRLDTAFFKVGESRGGLLVKFHGGEEASADELREDFRNAGLDVERLEEEGRFQFVPDRYPSTNRAKALEDFLESQGDVDRTVWVSFDWTKDVDLESALQQQQELTRFVDSHQIAAKTAVLEEAVEDWPPATHRQAQVRHSGMIWLSEAGVATSRMVPIDPE